MQVVSPEADTIWGGGALFKKKSIFLKRLWQFLIAKIPPRALEGGYKNETF